jgi:hypothetical protein
MSFDGAFPCMERLRIDAQLMYPRALRSVSPGDSQPTLLSAPLLKTLVLDGVYLITVEELLDFVAGTKDGRFPRLEVAIMPMGNPTTCTNEA